MGCFANSTEVQLAVDGDETFYVDFQRQEIVFTSPPFLGSGIVFPSDHELHHTFVNAMKNKKVCRELLTVLTAVEKNPTEVQGEGEYNVSLFCNDGHLLFLLILFVCLQ